MAYLYGIDPEYTKKQRESSRARYQMLKELRLKQPAMYAKFMRPKEVWRKLSKRGITKDQYLALLQEQNHKCAICGITESRGVKTIDEFSWSIDHDHTTGRVRGLLCIRCNTALGQVMDDQKVLLSMVEYLKKHNSPKAV